MDSSADVTSDTHSPSDSDVGLDGALDSTIDSAAELAPQSLLVSGEIAQCDNLARIGLAPTPSNTGREPLCISAFLSCKTRQFIEFSSVSCNIHAAQMLILVNVSGLSMILYGVLTFGFDLLPMTLPMLMNY